MEPREGITVIMNTRVVRRWARTSAAIAALLIVGAFGVAVVLRAAQTPPQRDLLAELTAQKATATIYCQVCGFQTDNRTAMEAHLLNHTTVE